MTRIGINILLTSTFFIAVLVFVTNVPAKSEADNRIIILYDSIGKHPAMQPDWGFAAYVEFNGKHMLFDTGNNAEILEQNSKAAEVDLSTIDFAVISHWHADHTAGLEYLRTINPNIPIYIPQDFSDTDKDQNKFKFTQLTEISEVSQDVFVISTIRDNANLSKLQELTLALQTSQGLILIAGCSHPGIQHIVEAATKIDARILNVLGGFHLLHTPQDKINSIAASLKEDYNVKQVAPGHCTGNAAVQEFMNIFQKDFIFAGLGTEIRVPR